MSVLSASANQKPPLPDPRHDPVHRESGPAARPAAAVVARALVAEVDLGGGPGNNDNDNDDHFMENQSCVNFQVVPL